MPFGAPSTAGAERPKVLDKGEDSGDAPAAERLIHSELVEEHLRAGLVRVQQLDARGVGVILEASHTCMTMRGVRKAGSICTTSAMRGIFKDNQSTRAELMALVYGSR